MKRYYEALKESTKKENDLSMDGDVKKVYVLMENERDFSIRFRMSQFDSLYYSLNGKFLEYDNVDDFIIDLCTINTMNVCDSIKEFILDNILHVERTTTIRVDMDNNFIKCTTLLW